MDAKENFLVGVLGGMGSAATADFFAKLVRLTPAKCDQDHAPVIIYNVPQIPDRSRAIMERGKSPIEELSRGAATLLSLGATLIAMPCNTAHFWHSELFRMTGGRLLHITDAVRDQLTIREIKPKSTALLATRGTIRSGVYGTLGPFVIPPESIQCLVDRAISAVKANQLVIAKELIQRACVSLRNQSGADHFVAACTELPIALSGTEFEATTLDPTEALATECVRRWLATRDP